MNHKNFQPDCRVYRISDPSRIGVFTGNVKKGVRELMMEIMFPDALEWIKESYLCLAPDAKRSSPDELFEQGIFGQSKDLRRVLVLEKLKGDLSEMIYAMDSADIEFMPYQYKPVLKFIESINNRLLLADEVGLGKTIEAGLIWQELRMRRKARRLLVLCPKTLASNWKSELLKKFSIKADIVDADQMLSWIEEVRASRGSSSFALIATYSTLRVTRADNDLIEAGIEPERASGKCFDELQKWSESYSFADLAIFDEAHILRNQDSYYNRTSTAYANASDGLVCVSATPINNGSSDLFSLLSILDPDLFENQSSFDVLAEKNQPSVKFSSALSAIPLNREKVNEAFRELKNSDLVRDVPLIQLIEVELRRVFEKTADAKPEEVAEALTSAQKMADQLNLLSNIISRTRRRQVKELPAIRDVTVLEVPMNDSERRFYESITGFIRKRLTGVSGKVQGGRFLAFGSISPQLRMASCMPEMVEYYRSRRKDFSIKEVCEALQQEDDFYVEQNPDSLESMQEEIAKLVVDFKGYDFEANDTKFNELVRILTQDGLLKNERKVVVFSFFRGTLSYLERRLAVLGITTCTLHGGIDEIEERQELIARFQAEDGPRVLLSSEVGSEGINLQFCRCVINYDLPWNPMRVEQRIGRIDRVGQKAERLAVIHFKVPGTIDACVYEKLYSKIEEAKLTIGDMESVLGKEVGPSDLIEVMFDDKKTDEERRVWLEQQTVQRIRRTQDLLQLEEKTQMFEGLSDFIRMQIDRGRRLSRFVTPMELSNFLKDFFEKEGVGSQFAMDLSGAGLYSLSLSDLAYQEFDAFCRKHHSDSAPRQKDQRMLVTFDKDVLKKSDKHNGRPVVLLTSTSPLIRWITDKLRKVNLHPTFRAKIKSDGLNKGDYVCLAQKWNFTGQRSREVLRYFIIKVDDPECIIRGDKAEALFMQMSQQGEDVMDIPIPESDLLKKRIETLRVVADEQFALEEDKFCGEDRSFCQIQLKKLEEHYEQSLKSPEKSIQDAKLRLAQNQSDPMLSESVRTKESNRILGQIKRFEKTYERVCGKYEPKIEAARKLADSESRDSSMSVAALGLLFVT